MITTKPKPRLQEKFKQMSIIFDCLTSLDDSNCESSSYRVSMNNML